MTPLKLSVDSEGRVHGPRITWNDPWPCRNGDAGGMKVPSGVLGMLVHTQVGNNPGSVSWFNNSASQASAHFCVAQDGSIVQMGPVNGWKAWHAAEGNPHWFGCEFADDGNPANPLTASQVIAGAQLLELLSRPDVGRFPLQMSNSPSTEGLGWHGMGGVAFGGHFDCPGDTRKAQRPRIIALAAAIRAGGSQAGPFRHTAPGGKTLGEIAAARSTTPEHVFGVSAKAYTAADVAVIATLPLPPGFPYYTSSP